MAGRMAGKVVIVTGAAQGIGRGCADLLAAEGARWSSATCSPRRARRRSRPSARRAARPRSRRPTCATEGQCAALCAAAVAAYGRLDALVNNVGWFPRATLEETTTDLWEAVMQVNLRGAFYCCKHAAPHLRAAAAAASSTSARSTACRGRPIW